MTRRHTSDDGRIVVRHPGRVKHHICFWARDAATAIRWVRRARMFRGPKLSRRYHWIERIGAPATR